MPLALRNHLHSLLRARKLDRTLTSALSPGNPGINEPGVNLGLAVASTGISVLDVKLGGGFPRGQLSELVGPRSSGRTSLLARMLAVATARGEIVALVDALDRFDVASGEAAGIDLQRLLWIRGHVVSNPGMCRDTNQRTLEQAVKALTLVLQAGNFGLVAFDVADAPPDAIRRLPFTTWLRLQRMVEGRQTVCLLVGAEPMARSSAGLTLRLERSSAKFQGRLFGGLALEARVIRARPSMAVPRALESACGPRGGGPLRALENVCLPLSTTGAQI